MGMDASAQIFYGYKECFYFNRDEDGYAIKIPEGFRCVEENNGDSYLAVNDSYEYTDWDYGLHQLFPQQMCLKEQEYFYNVKEYLDKESIPYKSEDIGWFIICDYS